MERITWVVFAAAVLGFPVGMASAGLTYSRSATAPTVDGEDIANLTTYDVGDPIASDEPALGQSFTTGGNAVGYDLDAITVQNTSYSDGTDMDYRLRVVPVSGSTLGTPLLDDTVTGCVPDPDEYVTFTFDTSIHLNPSTQYAFDLASTSSFVIDWALARDTNSTYSEGTAYRSPASGDQPADSTFSDYTGDRVFHLNMTPEPATLALLAVGGLATLMRRRK